MRKTMKSQTPEGYEVVKDGRVKEGDLIWNNEEKAYSEFAYEDYLIGNNVSIFKCVLRKMFKCECGRHIHSNTLAN